MIKQRTLKNMIRATGVGLHTGTKVYMTLRPAPANTGIVFRRTDLTPPAEIRGEPYSVGDTRLCSTLEKGNAKVATVDYNKPETLVEALKGQDVLVITLSVFAHEQQDKPPHHEALPLLALRLRQRGRLRRPVPIL